MRTFPMIAAVIATLISGPVFAKGCIRGAAAGSVAGHFVGKGHAIAGAAVGCVVADHHYAEQARAQPAAAKHAG